MINFSHKLKLLELTLIEQPSIINPESNRKELQPFKEKNMGSLERSNKGTPIAIERTMSPFFQMHKAVDEAMKNFYHMFEAPEFSFERLENLSIFPAMDLVEANDHYTFEFEMPGMGEEDINVSVNENRLTVKGEKSSSKQHKDKNFISREIRYGSYERSIDLPPSVDAEKATASFKKGMLWVKIPKKAGSKSASRKVKVEKAS